MCFGSRRLAPRQRARPRKAAHLRQPWRRVGLWKGLGTRCTLRGREAERNMSFFRQRSLRQGSIGLWIHQWIWMRPEPSDQPLPQSPISEHCHLVPSTHEPLGTILIQTTMLLLKINYCLRNETRKPLQPHHPSLLGEEGGRAGAVPCWVGGQQRRGGGAAERGAAELLLQALHTRTRTHRERDDHRSPAVPRQLVAPSVHRSQLRQLRGQSLNNYQQIRC